MQKIERIFKMMILFLKVFVMTWLTMSILVFAFQRYLIYVPDRKVPYLSNFDKKYLEHLTWKNNEGIMLSGFYHPAKINQPTFVIFHGNAGNIGTRKVLLFKLIEAGYGVFMPEYRGYGGVSGSPSEKGLYRDASSAIHFLYEKGVSYQQMIFFGESLGASVALEMAQRYPVAGVILQSPFLSLKSMAKLHYPWNFLPVLDKFDNLSKIKNIHMPLLIIHGTLDDLVPVSHGKRLFSQAQNSKRKELKLMIGEKHNLSWDDHYINVIRDYIDKDVISNYPTGIN